MSRESGVLLAAARGDLAAVKRHLPYVRDADECRDQVRGTVVGSPLSHLHLAAPPAPALTSCTPNAPSKHMNCACLLDACCTHVHSCSHNGAQSQRHHHLSTGPH
jgi:hypothetical protein